MPTLSPRAETTRAEIVTTAERLFRTLGYQKTAVADIARELGMSPANIYRFFPSKAAINEAICARTLSVLDELAWRTARGPDAPADRLRRLFAAMQSETMSLFFNEKKLHDMVTAAMAEHWPTIKLHLHSIETAIRHIVMDGQSDGSFGPMDPNEAAKLIHSTMIGFVHPQVIAQCAEEDLPGLAARMAEFVLCALAPRLNEELTIIDNRQMTG